MKKIILAGDAGATNTELALFSIENDGLKVLFSEKYKSAEHVSLYEIINKFISDKKVNPSAACIGVPGPVFGGKIISTNIPWEIDETELGNKLGIPNMKIVNDLEAAAAAIPNMNPGSLEIIYAGNGKTNYGNKMVIAPGTGLGMAILIHNKDGYSVIPTEGGHSDYAPVTDIEIELLKFLKMKFGRVSPERVISGLGILNIYEFLLTKKEFGNSENYFEKSEFKDIAAKISEEALNSGNDICIKVMDIFISSLAALCSSKVLGVNASGGVYLCGGIPRKILKLLSDGKFTEAYLNKGRLKYYIEPVPVYVVRESSAGLKGAALIAGRFIKSGIE
ncbi:MAG TPA: glucokinase [Ignavibacteria bacterium]|nr:glucokinase [Bacteroidota bacterium]HRI85342.1 glucokinase [Ignavibacteria bacterium]HRK00744.1 glucokinase [Ignavibacteria bacterium]